MVTYSLSPLKPSPHHPHVLFLSLYIRTLSLPWMYVIMVLFSIFTSLSPMVFHSISLTHRKCLPPVLFLSLYIHILSFPWFYVIMYSSHNFYSLSPAIFRSLPHTPHLATLWPFPFTTTACGSLPKPHTYTLFDTTCTSVPLPLFYLHPTTFPNSHDHNEVLSLDKHTHHCTSFLSPLPNQPTLQWNASPCEN